MSNMQHTLVRGGTTQDDRYKGALSPDKVRLDDRTMEDFIKFARKYSKHLNYYGSTNNVDGDWSAFWSKDISAVLANLSGFEMDDYQLFYSDLKNHMVNCISENSGSPSFPDAIRSQLRLLMHLPLHLVRLMVESYHELENGSELKATMRILLERELENSLPQLIAYYKGALDQVDDFTSSDLILDDFEDNLLNLPLTAQTIDVFTRTGSFVNFDAELPFITGTWTDYYNSIASNSNPFIDGSELEERIYDALNYNLFISTIESFFQAMVAAMKMFRRELEKTLSNYPSHAPHYSLWLVFVRLYDYARADLNDLTRRHLEFYYRDVLHLYEGKSSPNKVHLLFELSKDVDKYLLEKGVRFKAGKDATNKPVAYELMDDFLINRGKIAELKSFFNPISSFPIAASKIDTEDGIEKTLSGDYPYFNAFHRGQSDGSPAARVGFAIADRNLFLREGKRTISISFNEVMPAELDGASDFELFYTSDKGWEKVVFTVDEQTEVDQSNGEITQSYLIGREGFVGFGGRSLNMGGQRFYGGTGNFYEAPIPQNENEGVPGSMIEVEIGADLPAFVHFDPKVHITEEHPDAFSTGLPVLKVLVRNNFEAWRSFTYTQMALHVKVQGVKDIIVQNKDGVADVAKPFFIFGAIPDKVPSCTIGSTEIFSKKLTKLKFRFEWLDAYKSADVFNGESASSFNTKFSCLRNGKWVNGFTANTKKLLVENSSSNDVEFTSGFSSSHLGEQKRKNELPTSTSKSGFIKLYTTENFGHTEYPYALSQHLMFAADGLESNDLPKPMDPYSAKVSILLLDYETKTAAPSTYFELHPFGFRKSNEPKRIVPDYVNRGEMYIGVSGLTPPEKLTVLFQVRTGTADPLAANANMQWAYLKNNQWISSDFDVDDKTDQFAGSGIVGFDIPKEADTQSTLLPAGLHWIRMSVESNVDALNYLVSVDAQAATASFVDQNNDPEFLNGQLEAGTISKLEVSTSAIKKITQKYASFDGKPAEQSKDYYVRVSEMLRHKDRAITLWDYEHLVLQEFPKVYKVKCLNHTSVDEANKPGHVTIIPIPRIETIFKDPLRPYTDKKTRVEIYEFLKKRTSTFVCLHVEQPLLEAVQIECKVRFTDEISDIVFYKQKLNSEIIQFLSPWAFKDGRDVSFGGRWYKADLINFIDERPYVKYVIDFKLYHHIEAEDELFTSFIDTEVAMTTTQRSILVSARNHIIFNISNDVNVNAESDCVCDECACDE